MLVDITECSHNKVYCVTPYYNNNDNDNINSRFASCLDSVILKQWFSTGGLQIPRGLQSNFKVVHENVLNLYFLI